MKDDKVSLTNSGKENEPVLENGKKKGKEEKPATKVVIRRLPPSMTEEQFKMQVSPMPDYDYFYYVTADMTLSPNAFCRAYINFLDQNDLFIFTQKFDGYVFVDSKGGEYPAVVEFAPFQRIPKNRPNRKKDPKIDTIEAEAFYIAFKEQLEAENLEKKASANVSKQHFFETSVISEKKEANNTPLLDFIKNRKAERQRIRDEKREEKRKKDLERRRAKEDQKRIKKEDETSVVKTSPLPSSPIPPMADIQEMIVCNESTKCTEHKKESSNSSSSILKDTNLTIQKKLDMFPFQKTEKPVLIQKVQDLVNYFSLKNSEPVANTSAGFNPVPLTTRNGKVFVPQSSVDVPSYSANKGRDILVKPTRVGVGAHSKTQMRLPASNIHIHASSKQSVHYGSKKQSDRNVPTGFETNEAHETLLQSKSIHKTFPAETFSKNLKQVVEDVLGSSKVKTTKECVINKPKIFVKRTGSGDQCKSSDLNTASFYLPPRAFGCGPTESINKLSTKERYINPNSSQYEKTFSASLVRGNIFKFSANPLPPFSKKSIFFSKSDGSIESKECVRKIGGSDESFRKKSNYLPFDSKPRPHLAFKRPFKTDKKK